MPVHKMTTIDGVRYRPEDAARLMHARERAQAGAPEPAAVLGMRQADPPRTSQPPAGDAGTQPEPVFDPGAHTVAEVLMHLDSADATETARVLAAEAAGKARKTVLEKGAPTP
jgi:hypothetical protein